MKTITEYTFCKTYRLLAQTPMIHFQQKHDGAALRPSEVKPKLDRYLRSLVDNLPENWLISKDQPALNYRMQITAAAEHPESNSITIDECKAYFGNQGSENPKGLVFRNCELRIICMIPALLKLIDEHIGAFFILQNFGSRQSKGLGGFLVEGRMSDELINRTLRSACPYYFYADFKKNTLIKERLNHAVVVYACLKNGFQMGKNKKFYGYVTNEFIDESIGNDQQFFRDQVIQRKPRSYDSYLFVRAVLGMADLYPYPQKRTAVQVVHFNGTSEENGSLRIPLESIEKQAGIKRFRSPIQIKIFKHRMYFLFWDDCHDILGQIFLVMEEKKWKTIAKLINDGQYRQAQAMLQREKHISTPDTFDRSFFMRDFVDYFNDEREKLKTFPRDWRPTSELVLKKGES